MDDSKQASFEFSLEWQSKNAGHRERHYFPKINFWRDFFPGTMGDRLNSLKEDETVSESLDVGQVVEPFDKNKIFKIYKRKLNLEKLAEKGIRLNKGRFYPKSFLSPIGFSSQDIRPFRVLDSDETLVTIDANHPLYAYPLTITGKLCETLEGRCERGGSGNDVGMTLAYGGPGLQVDLPETPTDFFDDNPFARDDESDDRLFYQSPRLVSHIDRKASEIIGDIYDRFLKPGMKVLDLMASWESHLAIPPGSISLTGLGLNKEELEKNPHIDQAVVHDLNQDPKLPFFDNEYDVAICSTSIEYLINPFEVMAEVARVLKPGAPFIVTFSDRWFDPKVIKIWQELHPFERMGLVSRYLQESALFKDLHTESVRGYPRPDEDRHSAVRSESDPVFAVWGYRNSGL